MATVNEDLSQLLGRLAAGIDDVIEAEMSTALEVVGEEASTAAGNLAEIGLPVLMGRIFSEGTTGRLRIWQEQVEKNVYFEAGLPVMAASNDVADRMLAMLVRERAVSPAQREEVEKVVDASGRKVGGVLVDLGLLRSDELLPAVRRHYESIILSLFGWSAGLWQIEPGMTAGPERTRLLRHPAALVREGLARGYAIEKIAHEMAIADESGKIIGRNNGFPEVFGVRFGEIDELRLGCFGRDQFHQFLHGRGVVKMKTEDTAV